MPVQFSHPGVYIHEVTGGSRAVVGVATAITAFVGRALRGPVEEPVAVSSFGEFERVFGGLWRTSGLGYAVQDYFRNGGQTALVVRLAPDADPAEANIGGLRLQAANPGTWGNDLEVTVEYPEPDEAAQVAEAQGSGVTTASLYHLRVTDTATGFQEEFLNVTGAEGPRHVKRVLLSSQLIRAVDVPPVTPPTDATYPFPDNGTHGAPLQLQHYRAGGRESKKGIYALEKADLFTLLCLPPPTPASDIPDELWADALDYCERKRAFLIVDPPGGARGATALRAWLGELGLNVPAARNSALYFPRIRRSDPLRDGTVDEFAPCGAVAGVMARTDVARGVWKAPAGIDAGLAGAQGLAVDLTDAEQGPLNLKGINCLRTFRDSGSVVWGARTLRGADVLADDYKYVPVRRLALFLEESLFRGSQWVVFEPNDEPLWAQIRTSLGAFMQDLFRQGAFQGANPRDAYFVRCDGQTNTPYDIDRGLVNIHVGFAPLKPAEFVLIHIQQKTAGSPA
ncbi:phage tail sheath family protein [Streptomyces sp. NBC_01244]|uniref:phage tail sheath family protein n=1 Tax=Streptomyces sp. NBC_01244 TaxID=2903797 RepID=UPI002E1435F3|nr:phage tail sheath subtilisin-like domain-containing protein [Streptomyces sp. NBC_01244]